METTQERRGDEPKWPTDFSVQISPDLFPMARFFLAEGHRNLVPPLMPEDIIFLVGMGIAAKQFYPQVPVKAGDPPPFEHHVLLDVLGVLVTVAADAHYAARAGFLYVTNFEALHDSVLRRYSAWHSEVYTPACGGPWCDEPDLSPRGKTLKRQEADFFRLFFRPNYERMLSALQDAVVGNVGGNEWDPRRKEKLPKDTVLGWLKVAAEANGFMTTAMDFTDGELSFHPARSKESLDSYLGAAVPLREDWSFDHEIKPGTSTKPGIKLGNILEAQEPPVEVAAALAELRDVRDALGLRDEHPQVNELVESQIHSPTMAGDFTTFLRRLVQRLTLIEDPALQGAVVYALGGLVGEGHPQWNRATLAAQYGVTARQIELRQEQAATILAETKAA